MGMVMTMKGDELRGSSRAGLGMLVLGLPLGALGALTIAVALRAILGAAVAGSYMATPALIGTHAVRLGVSACILGLGLLMMFGGTYLRLSPSERTITVRNFYGFFARAATYDFSEVVHVVIRCERPDRAFHGRHHSLAERPRRARTIHKVELELRDGRRALLGSSVDKESVRAAGDQVAALVGVKTLDIGLVGSVLRRTGA